MNKKMFKEILEKHSPFPLIKEKYIDYVSEDEGKVVGILVKGSRSNIYTTIGELFYYKKIFSHLYVAAPLNFVKKLILLIEHNPLYNDIGFITINNNAEIITIKKPQSKVYYFKLPKRARKIENKITINNSDLEIMKKFEGKYFTVIDVMNAFNLSRKNAYRRIDRLKKVGVVDEVVGEKPKKFIIKSCLHQFKVKNS